MKLQHLFTIAIMALAPLSCAEEEKTISLFDGKTLDGWKSVGGNGQFKVEDGCIVGFGENIDGNTFLRTEKVYGDFELTYRCKGNHIQTWLNGEKRVDYTDNDAEHDTREGFFGLQVHKGASCNIRWRNLKLKQL